MITVVIGVRPHYVKLAGFYAALARQAPVRVVNTGQHFDAALSDHFLTELGLPRPEVNLDVHGTGAAEHVADSMRALAEPLAQEHPHMVVVIGDANAALAGALAAAELDIPVAHIEAGLRNAEPGLPEEANRRAIDAVASLHLCPTMHALENMRAEGRAQTSHFVGDLLYDVARMQHRAVIEHRDRWLQRIPAVETMAVVTLHRASTLKDPVLLRHVLENILRLEQRSVWVLHPGTEAALRGAGLLGLLHDSDRATVLGPLAHAELLGLLAAVERVLSDSNGVQRESMYVGAKCFILRAGTEYPETVWLGAAALVAPSEQDILGGLAQELRPATAEQYEPHFGNGDAGLRIAERLTAMHAAL
jgi:UDP-N-acetylglucosamine 2-epimerase